jgi:energy-coupling factor transport system substrate-specific component
MDEAEIDEFTKFMNKEIVKSAKEYMGEDMNIPLGTSIGAVRVPTEGNDFDQLFRLADKALYIVKQNGKHGYAFYQKRAEGKDLDAEGKDNNNLSKIKKIIGERNEGKGAYSVNFDRFQVLYKYINRSDKVNKSRSGIIRFILEDKNGDNVSDEIRDKFEEHLIVNLKKNDVVSIYSSSFFVLLTKITGDVESDVADRIISKWKENEGDICTVNYEIENVG